MNLQDKNKNEQKCGSGVKGVGSLTTALRCTRTTKESHCMLCKGFECEPSSKAQIMTFRALDDIINHATKVQKQVKVRNKHYSMTYSSVSS